MTVIQKLINKISENPESVRYTEIETVLLHFGFYKLQGKGSHVKFVHRDYDQKFVFAVHGNDCKNVYKRYVRNVLKNNNFLKS